MRVLDLEMRSVAQSFLMHSLALMLSLQPSPLSTRPSFLRPIRSEDRPCALHRPLGDLPLHPFSTISSRRGQTAFNIEALGTLEDETQLSLHTAGDGLWKVLPSPPVRMWDWTPKGDE